ncbi:AI-2E family transporter [Neobacillus vireti]|uniref:AI-2E family transporter n=1 Tax=Neobacillus vireti TaxID=220686 RepID=UPI002FFEC9E7
MNFFKHFFKDDVVIKVFSLVILVIMLFSLKGLLNLFLLAFIFSYLLNSLQIFLFKHIQKVFPKMKEKFITIGMFLSIILVVVFGLAQYIPRLTKELIGVSKKVTTFDFQYYLDKFTFIKASSFETYAKEGLTSVFHALPHISEISLQFIIALILTFFILIGKKDIVEFCQRLEGSKFKPIYNYYKYLGINFANTFGKVLQIQILISFINASLSLIGLSILGFDKVLGLAFMMFILGIIPVAGAIISFIPLAIIGFTIGGVTKIIWLIVMIAGLHAIESYVLNPRLMSHETKVPMFITFITLTISEHFLGIWGLLLGIPLLMFLLDLFGVKIKDK